MTATARFTIEPKFTMFFGNKDLITIGKGQIRYWTFPEKRYSTRTKHLEGRNAALKQRREATFIDICHTKTAIFVLAIDVSYKWSNTR